MVRGALAELESLRVRERNLQNQVASLLAKERACQKNHQVRAINTP